jgi:hypothetical protein
MLSTLPAVILLDSVGRRPLLISGAAGCLICLLVVGALVTMYGKDWPAHEVAAHTAIGKWTAIALYKCMLSTFQPLCFSTMSISLTRGLRLDGVSSSFSPDPLSGSNLCQSFPAKFSHCICGPLVFPSRHRPPGSQTCACCYHLF